ncbi:hypothetical protein JB92DRAFT_2839034 [Gautieria morchelliformis]|nr:hypothetical protein JB92DRAFT_2839034 [Gautieria morchelliformis]
MDGASLAMAHPNGLREDALNLAVNPAMAMATEFDRTIDASDWDMIFRKLGAGDVAPIDDPSSSAPINDVLFNLDFGDPDVGLREEMERDLEEAWNMKVNKEQVEPVLAVEGFYFEGYICFLRWLTLRVPMKDNRDLGIRGMYFIDDPFVPGVEVDLGMENGAVILQDDKLASREA